jgi:amylosucrase
MATSVGIPLLYLGDEIAPLNDYAAAADPARDGDNRWMHRPRFDWEALARAEEGLGPAAPVLAGLRRLLRLRRRHPALGAAAPELVPQPDPAVLAFVRAVPGDAVAVVVNLADREAVAHLHLDGEWLDDLTEGAGPADPAVMPLPAYGVRILTRRDRS